MFAPGVIRISVPRREAPVEAQAPGAPSPAETLALLARQVARVKMLLPEQPTTITVSSTERRVLTEIAKRKSVRHAELMKKLAIDRGQLSRLLKKLEDKELVVRRSAEDKRHRPLAARPEARKLLRRLEAIADEEFARALAPLGIEAQRRLALRLGEVVTLLEGLKGASPEIEDAAEECQRPELRLLKRGELGLAINAWLARRPHADEARLFGLAQRFLEGFDAARDIGWVAEGEGKLAGCSLLKGMDGTRAELTLLIVERDREDVGLVRELIEVALSFAEGARHATVTTRLFERDEAIEDALEVTGFAEAGEGWRWRAA